MSNHASPDRQPLLTRSGIIATISALVSLLVSVGILPQTVGDQINSTAGAVTAAVLLVMSTAPALVHAFASRSAVTPLSDPRDNDGNRLVPAGSETASSTSADLVLAQVAAIADGPPQSA